MHTSICIYLIFLKIGLELERENKHADNCQGGMVEGSTFHKHAFFDCFQLNSPHKQSSFYLFRWTVIRSEFLFQPISQQSFFKTQTKNKTLLSHYKTVFWNIALFKTQCLNSLLLTPDFNANNPYLQRFYLFTVCTDLYSIDTYFHTQY